MKISAINVMTDKSKLYLKAMNEEPTPVENPSNGSSFMSAMDLQGQNNMAFHGGKTALAKKGVKAGLVAMMLAASASCIKMPEYAPPVVEGNTTTVVNNVTIDLTMLQSIYEALINSNNLQAEEIKYLKQLYEQSKKDSEAANAFYEFAYDYMMNDANMQAKIYAALEAQGYTSQQIKEYLASIDSQIKDGTITFAEAMKIIQGLLQEIDDKIDVELMKNIYNTLLNLEGLSSKQIAEIINLYNQAQTDSKAANEFYKAAYMYMMQDSYTQQMIYQALMMQGYTEKQIKEYLANIDAKLDAGQMSFEEAMKTIEELLESIDVSLDEIKAMINNFVTEYEKNEKEAAKDRKTQISLMQGIWANGNITNYQMTQLISGQNKLIDKVDKQNKSLSDIKSAITKLNIDMNTDFKGLAAKLGMSTNELVNTLNKLGIVIKDSTGKIINNMDANTGDVVKAIDNASKQLKQSNIYLAKIERYSALLPTLVAQGWITNTELNNIKKAIDNIDVNVDVELSPEMFEQLENIVAKLDQIHGDISGLRQDMNNNQTAIYNAILENGANISNLEKLVQTNNAQNEIMIGQNKAIIEELKGLNKRTASIEEIAMATGIDVEEIKEMLKDLHIDITAEVDLSKVIEAINKDTEAVNANTEYMKQLSLLVNASFKDITDILKNIDKQVKVNGDLLESQDAKLALIYSTLKDVKDELAKFDPQALAKLEEILQAIKDKKCDCDCKGSEIVAKLEIIINKINNHEGIIDDLDDLFN